MSEKNDAPLAPCLGFEESTQRVGGGFVGVSFVQAVFKIVRWHSDSGLTNQVDTTCA